MSLEEFKLLHRKFENIDDSKQGLRTGEYREYVDLIYENQEFHNWVLKCDLEKKGFNDKDYCCLVMANNISESLDENQEIKQHDHDVIMNKWKNGTFGIPIHDGGSSVVKINFCPWCGVNLKKDE
jgi:hypothetical protein